MAGVLSGLVVGWLVVFGVEALLGNLFPLPPGTDPKNLEALKAAMAHMPLSAFLGLLFGWILAAFIGMILANRIAGVGRAPGLIVGTILFAGAVFNLILLPHPIWFWGLTLVAFPLSILGATSLTQIPPAP